ncbi:MAG: metallophosphoesterase [Candidatus Sericytochromatia bacterium]|nr:metallophosphoesterase [Candidatus Sericytochromatia bacterium]
MKIQYMSDLHLEFPENREYFRVNPIDPIGDVLILAGDIICDTYREEANDFFQDIESKFKFIISTMGNHEFYFGNTSYAYPSYEKYLSDNHIMLNNKSIVIDNVRFIVSVLWSQIDPLHQVEISQRLNDYKLIRKNVGAGTEIISVDDTNYYHQISKEFIEKELNDNFKGKNVLVTHHLPSFDCIDPKWKNSTLLSAFANHLDDLILKNKIDSWIFGHQHEQFNSLIGKTKMLSNPLGYAKEANFRDFNSQSLFELN